MIFETQHFVIRQWTFLDIPACVSFWNDPEVMKFLGDGALGGGEEVVRKVLTENIAFYAAHPGLGSWAVLDKATGQVMGEAGLGLLTETGEVEVGYILRKDYWGRGLGTELLKSLLNHGFSNLGLNQIVAVCNPENLASARIMEKCGMTFVSEVLNDGDRVSKYVTSSNHFSASTSL